MKSGVACSCERRWPCRRPFRPIQRARPPLRARSAPPKNGGPWILLCLRRSDWACYSCPHSTEHVQWPTAAMACAHHPPQSPPAPFHPSPTPPGPRVSGPARRTSQDASAPRSWVSSSATRRYARRRPQAAFAPSRPAPMRATRRRLQSTSAAFFCTWHKTSRSSSCGHRLGPPTKDHLLPLLRPPSPPTLPLLPPLLLPTASPPLPFLPSPRLYPRLGPGPAASPPHLATLMAHDRRRARRSSSTRSSVPRRASRRRRPGRASGFPRSAHRASRDARDTHPRP